jgi:hypothetical protein
MRKKTFFFTVVILMVLIPFTTVFAAWGGEPDGNQHPMVGAMYADFDGDGAIYVLARGASWVNSPRSFSMMAWLPPSSPSRVYCSFLCASSPQT